MWINGLSMLANGPSIAFMSWVLLVIILPTGVTSNTTLKMTINKYLEHSRIDTKTNLKVDVKILSSRFAWMIREALSDLYIQNMLLDTHPIRAPMMLPAE